MSELFKPLQHDRHIIQGYYPLTEEQIAKCDLNAQYGTMITQCKGVNVMNRDYIVVHFNDHKTGIIFKDKIVGVFAETLGEVEETLILTESKNTYVIDKYADIVKQLI